MMLPESKRAKSGSLKGFQRDTWIDTPKQGQYEDEMDPKWVCLWFSSSWFLIIE